MLERHCVELEYVKIFRSEIKNEHINLSGNVLVISDRLLLLASEFISCMESVTDVNVLGLINDHNDLGEFENGNIDYLIMVGYFKNEKNYDVVSRLRRCNKNLKTVFWAIMDNCIYHNCTKYNINFYFDRMEPVGEFLNYLIEIKERRDSSFDGNGIDTSTEEKAFRLDFAEKSLYKNLAKMLKNILARFNG